MPRDDDAHEDLHRFETPDEALQYIRYAGTLPDAELDLGETALALALLFLPGVNPDRYRNHLAKLCDHAREEHRSRLRMGERDNLALRIQILRKIVHEAHGYAGDNDSYDDLQNASLIRVIERRRGLPISLGILYVVVARAQAWHIDGLSFPGHFLVRMEMEGERAILDPFDGGRELGAAELRKLLKAVAGGGAELAHDYYLPVTSRAMLIRLQNNLKKRLIEGEDYAQALVVTEAMEALAPEEHRILFDKGVLYVKLGQGQQAVTALGRYVEKVTDPREKRQVSLLIEQIMAGLP